MLSKGNSDIPASPTFRESSDSRTLEAGLRLLRVLQCSPRPLSAVELCELTHLSRSTAYRLLRTLVSSAFVAKTANGFAPGPFATQVAQQDEEQWLASEPARRHLRNIAAESRETALITVLRWPYAYALSAVEGPTAIRCSFAPGTMHPLHAGASAKVLLAQLSDEVFADYRRLIPPLFNDRNTHWQQLAEELLQVRREGFASSHDEVYEGVSAVAVPLAPHATRLVASLSLVGPSFRFNPSDFVQPLKQFATQLSDELNATFGPTSPQRGI